jgi:hypothetical protein
VKPEGHGPSTHVPELHTFAGRHPWLHIPQWTVENARSTQLPLQSASGGGHVAMHPVGPHFWPGEHAWLQAPQSLGVVIFLSQPSVGLLLQLSHPALHVPIAHAPFSHLGVA